MGKTSKSGLGIGVGYLLKVAFYKTTIITKLMN